MTREVGYYRRQIMNDPSFDAQYVELGDWVIGYMAGENDDDRSEASALAFGRLACMKPSTSREQLYTPAEIRQRIA